MEVKDVALSRSEGERQVRRLLYEAEFNEAQPFGSNKVVRGGYRLLTHWDASNSITLRYLAPGNQATDHDAQEVVHQGYIAALRPLGSSVRSIENHSRGCNFQGPHVHIAF
jgi:diadenosine tetraphosphatase ApaH/serine/threonine PP2A family protein phosphatase